MRYISTSNYTRYEHRPVIFRRSCSKLYRTWGLSQIPSDQMAPSMGANDTTGIKTIEELFQTIRRNVEQSPPNQHRYSNVPCRTWKPQIGYLVLLRHLSIVSSRDQHAAKLTLGS